MPTITVINGNDSGAGSLRQAIADALSGDTINFSLVTLVTLTTAELLINKNLTITGPGSATLTIKRSTAGGTPDFRVFNVTAGTVAISGLTVNNGNVPVGDGGGMSISVGAVVALSDVRVTGNSARGAGGIYNAGTLTLTSCTVDANSIASDAFFIFGAGILNDGGSLTATSTVISANWATGPNPSGGGIHNRGTLTLTECSITSNVLTVTVVPDTAPSGRGAGIADNGTGVYTDVTIDANVMSGVGTLWGGGLFVAGTSTVSISRSTLSNNVISGSSDARGGGLYVLNTFGLITLVNVTVSSNEAAYGGGIYDAGSTTIKNMTITENTTTNLASGALHKVATEIIEIRNTIIAGNTASTYDFYPAGSIVFIDDHNLLGTFYTGGGYAASGTDIITADPLLGALQDNGGPTFTHGLLAGSPALNVGNNTGAPATDQRGEPRILDLVIDIGAFEGIAANGNGNGNDICPPCATLTAICAGTSLTAICGGTLVTNCNPQAQLFQCNPATEP